VSTFYFIALCALALSCTSVTTQLPEFYLEPESKSGTGTAHVPLGFDSPGVELIQDIAKPRPHDLFLNLWEVVKVRASYFERREPIDAAGADSAHGKPQRHFDLLATSSLAGTALTGEGELAYSELGAFDRSDTGSEPPMMLRLAFKTRWDALSYGAEYKSSHPGYVALTGAKTDIRRDDAQIWGERSWGALKFRSSIVQRWEKAQDSSAERVTRSAAATLNYSHRQWAGSLASSYALTEEDTALDQEIGLVNHRISASYRPISFVSLDPSFGLTQEWNTGTGVRSETPETGLAVVYTPRKDSLRLTGMTSFARRFDTDGAGDIKTLRAGAALDWKIGRFLGTTDKLSVSLDYHQRRERLSPGNSHGDFRTMLQWKVTGF
jgi:hypothetical protein